jgi:ABC-2 type transport system permease protein
MFMVAGGAALAAEWPDAMTRAALVGSLELLPPVIRALLGDPIALDTMGGFLSWRFGGVAPIMLGIWSVVTLSGALTTEARRGSLDLVATTPVSRASIATQKALAHVAQVAVVVIAAALLTTLTGIVFGTLPADDIPIGNALGAWVLTGVLMVASGAVAFATAPILGRTRGASIGVAFLFGGYLVSAYRSVVPSLAALEPLSWYAWTKNHRPLAGQWDWPPVVLLAGITAALLALGVLAFVRRDIGATVGVNRFRLRGFPAGTRRPFTRLLADLGGDGLGWGLGIGAYGAFVAASATDFAAVLRELPGMQGLVERFYPGIDLDQPSALLELAFVAFGSLLIGLAAAGFVSGLASSENGRRLDLVLSTPTSRSRWFVESGLAVLGGVAITAMAAAALMVVAVAAAGGDPVGPLVGCGVLAAYGAAFAGLGLALAGLGWPRRAAAATAVLSIASYLLGTLGSTLQLPEAIVDLSLGEHLGRPMTGSVDVVGLGVMLLLAIGGLAVGAWGIRRRDLSG